MTIRAVRGWSLGSPFSMKELEACPLFAGCGCSYTKPYLHSPVFKFVHWDGPVVSNHNTEWRGLNETLWEVAVGFLGTRDMKVMPERVERRSGRHEGIFGPPNLGGFYSYLPEYADRMGNWEEIDVLGVVTLFSEIVIHEHGYRSNGIRIDRLWVMDGTANKYRPETLRQFLEETYQCDAIIIRGESTSFREWVMREDVDNLFDAPS